MYTYVALAVLQGPKSWDHSGGGGGGHNKHNFRFL